MERVRHLGLASIVTCGGWLWVQCVFGVFHFLPFTKGAVMPQNSSASSHDRLTRRHVLGAAAAAGAALMARGLSAEDKPQAASQETLEKVVTNGRIQQSVVHWCFSPYWDAPKLI